MANFKIKKLPPIRLVDLLKKRKITLKQFFDSYGIVAYSTLVTKCNSMGVSPPPEEEFKHAINSAASSPQEGIIVLDSPSLTKESTGEKISVDELRDFRNVEIEVLPAVDKTIVTTVEQSALKKSEEKIAKIEIDESVFITTLPTEIFEKTGTDLGDIVSVEDNIDYPVSKLSTLKKTK